MDEHLQEFEQLYMELQKKIKHQIEKVRQNLEYIQLKFDKTIEMYDEMMIGDVIDSSIEIMKYMPQAIEKYCERK